jgi:dipeptidyl aminopeptidase/acylaminoacyl peptidase
MRHRQKFLLCSVLALPLLSPLAAQERPNKANWQLADKFSPANLRSKIFTATVNPRWLGQSDSLCYDWKDHNGSAFYLVVPTTKTKRPLFDQAKLAAQLSEQSHRAYDPQSLPFTSLTFAKDHKSFTFTADSSKWEWQLATETLQRLGPSTPAGGRGRGAAGGQPPAAPPDTANTCGGGGGRGGAQANGGGRGGGGGEFRNYSPDSSMFAFARNHNLYVVKVSTGDTTQLTRDGVKYYSFGARDTVLERQQQELQRQQTQNNGDGDDDQGGGSGSGSGGGIRNPREQRVRAQVTWSPDSKAFAVTRMDQRKVKPLFLVNNTANPRPELMEYTYAMPGEENVSQEELYLYKAGDTKLEPVNVKKWKDQRLFDIHWNGKGSDHLRMVRRDRTQRHFELLDLDVATQRFTQLLQEDIDNNSSERQNVRYVKAGGDFIWWSERSGWGHYYLYDNAGKLKHPLTSGAWRAERIVELDSVKGVLYVAGVGRETAENPYYTHTYRVNLDGTGFALIDPGNGTHNAQLSPNKKWIVDSYSRVDLVPKSVLRDPTGKVVMDLEEMDVSKLRELGWRPPETFTTKAADGVTNIYGNIWKPFDFDSTKKYPIIANVYPGPQTESVTFPFTPANVPQQLAQLGFVVIQIGNRGGSPQRSQQYQGFSYYNLRDYALADKKAGIEQLAARYKWIDLDKVGIYGHSGGGFLTAAAMMLPPYNEFFKVGVSESGNHDNNIYNQNWSEQYHGLKVVAKAPARGQGVAQAGAPAGGPRNADGNGNGNAVNGRGAGNPNAAAAAAALVDGSIAADDSLNAFQIHVPTTVDLAANLKGNLLLETGDMDNNVHPANTIRLVQALIKANKRFDLMILPGKPHGYGDMVPYTNRLMFEYFAEHLLGDYYRQNATYR